MMFSKPKVNRVLSWKSHEIKLFGLRVFATIFTLRRRLELPAVFLQEDVD